jgi:glycosyltransferase involved in cell wall biosynthesis
VCIVPQATRAGDAWRERLGFWLDSPLPGLVQAFRSLHVDLVHAHFGTNATDVWPSVRAAGLPMLVTLHGYDINVRREWWEAGYGGVRRRAYPRRLLRMARDPGVGFVAVSEAIRQRATTYGIPAGKITVAYIGVDTRRFRPAGLPLAQRANRVLFVGRMTAKKVPLLTIRAFAQVRNAIPDAELVMVGDGPLLGDAKALASELGVPVSFLGAVTPDQVLEQMHEAKVFCLPSIVADNGDAEGLPISILEAQACGVPVVTTEGGGNAEGMVGDAGGRLVAENDLAALADAIRSLLMQPPPGAGHPGGFPERFEIAACTRKLESLYDGMAWRARATTGATA